MDIFIKYSDTRARSRVIKIILLIIKYSYSDEVGSVSLLFHTFVLRRVYRLSHALHTYNTRNTHTHDDKPSRPTSVILASIQVWCVVSITVTSSTPGLYISWGNKTIYFVRFVSSGQLFDVDYEWWYCF